MKYILLGIALLAVLATFIGLQTNVQNDIATTTSDVVVNTGISDGEPDLIVGPAYGNVGFCDSLTDLVPSFAVDISAGDTVTTGDDVSGCVQQISGSYNNWAPFEGYMGGYRLYASDGTLLGEQGLSVDASLPPTSDWMTLAMAGDDLLFSQGITFDASGYATGTIEFYNDNASGEPANDVTVTLPVSF